LAFFHPKLTFASWQVFNSYHQQPTNKFEYFSKIAMIMEVNPALEDEEKTLRAVQYSSQNDNDMGASEDKVEPPSINQGEDIDGEKEEYVGSTTIRGEDDILEGATIGENDITDNQALSSDDEEVRLYGYNINNQMLPSLILQIYRMMA
jgi:hypothetical protein